MMLYPNFWTAQPNTANVPHVNFLSLAPVAMIPNAPRPFDFDLGDSAEMIRDSARTFAEREIAPRAGAIDRDNLFPRDLWPKMGALGLHGITAPEEYGGLALGYLEHCVAMEEVSRASGSVSLSYGAHSNLCVNHIARNGNEEQKARYLPKLGRPLDYKRNKNVDYQRPGRRDADRLRQDRPGRR